MSSFSDKLRQFIRKDTVLFATMAFLAMLNVLIAMLLGPFVPLAYFPWSLIPIGGIMIAVFDDFAKIFLTDDDSSLAAQLAQVRRYKRDIDKLAKSSRGERFKGVAAQFDEWVGAIERMSERVNSFEKNAAIQHDLHVVPESIRKLETQLAVEKDKRVRAQLQSTLATRRNQLASLENLQGTMRAAEIQLESAIASLGTIHAQLLASQSTNQIADYSHLAADAQEQTRALNEYLEALEEVKLRRATTSLGSESER